MSTKDISNSEDVIDSRDIIDRIEELRGELDGLIEAVNDAENDEDKAEAVKALAEWLEYDGDDVRPGLELAVAAPQSPLRDYANSDEAKELFALEALRDEAEGYADDWKYGAALIRESYFTEYCEELVKDIGDMPKEIPHYIEIDWQKTADNIRVDYTEVEFDGVTYLVR